MSFASHQRIIPLLGEGVERGGDGLRSPGEPGYVPGKELDMRDDRKTKSELAGEVAHLRRRVAELEASDTGCKRTERELKVSDRALASSINAIAMADLEGNIAYVNPSFLDMWGYESESEVLGRPAAAFWESGEQARAIVEAVFEGRGWWGELTARRRDGSLFNVELSASMVTDEEGKPICMLGSFIDISARKQAERALQESQDRLRALIENAPDAIYLNDLNGKFIDGNKRAEEMVGYAREGLVGRSLFEAGVLPAEHLPKALESLQRNREGEASGPDEFE
ncbi:MAG: PAS domain-containing protein, partial [Chloroflexota bacterium]